MATTKEELRATIAKAKKVMEDAEAALDDSDGLKGTVGEPEEVPETTEEGLVLEKADSGKGYSIFRDYSRLPADTKFQRLKGR